MRAYVPVALLIAGFSGAALAQEMPPFEEVDANQDGVISQEEAAAVEGMDFASHDTNQDGQLDRAEYESSGQE
jgi:hypothetical protein